MAGGGQELGLATVRFLRISACHVGRGRLLLQLADQVNVFVSYGQRMHHQIVEVVTEAQYECQHDEHHRGEEHVHLVAAERDAQDQRHESREHEPIERRLVDRGQVDAAQHHAEQADDQQRLMTDVARHEQDHARNPPQRTGDGRAQCPRSTPSHALQRRWRCGAIAAGEAIAPCLVRADRKQPRCEQQRRGGAPHDRGENRCAQKHRYGRAPPLGKHRGDLIGAHPRAKRRIDAPRRKTCRNFNGREGHRHQRTRAAGGSSRTPRRANSITTCVRVWTLSARSMALTCTFTVPSDSRKSRQINLFGLPWTSNFNTSAWRTVKPSSDGLATGRGRNSSKLQLSVGT